MQYTAENVACDALRRLGQQPQPLPVAALARLLPVAQRLAQSDCEEHAVYRHDCCDYMLEHAEDLRLFHADEDFEDEEESFEAYVEHMRSPARWGSQLELMALCRRHEVNAIVHQHGLPAYEMVFAPPEARCIQVSYHDGEHYNSVRFATDMEPGRPARFLSLREVRGLSLQLLDLHVEDTDPSLGASGVLRKGVADELLLLLDAGAARLLGSDTAHVAHVLRFRDSME